MLVIAIAWTPTSAKAVLPDFDGTLELVRIDPSECRLTVSGTYGPPLGTIGAELDAAVMHKVAEATVRDVAESIAERLDKAPV
jgi:hypothetical protein